MPSQQHLYSLMDLPADKSMLAHELARTDSVLAYDQRGSPCKLADIGKGRTDNATDKVKS